MLPAGLLTIKLEEGQLTRKGASKLPKSLTSLSAYFDVFDKKKTMSYLWYIPNIKLGRSLDSRRKTLSKSKWLSSLLPSPSSAYNRNCISGCTDLSHYNHHLTTLSIDVGRHLAKSSYFESLPKFKNLNTLWLFFPGCIPSDVLCLIPENVTDLRLDLVATFPKASQLSKLPTRLRCLHLVPSSKGRICPWNDKDLQSLPRSLQVLKVYGEFLHLTHRMYDYLPPNLQDSSLKHKTKDAFIDFIPPLDRLY